MEVLKTFTDVFNEGPVDTLTPLLQKVTPPLREIVRNADEVITGFQSTPYAEMVADALR